MTRLFLCLLQIVTTSCYIHNLLLLVRDGTRLTIALEAALERAADESRLQNVDFTGKVCIVPNSNQNPYSVLQSLCDCLENTTASGIIGPYTSDQTLVVAYLTTLLRIPTISPTASAGILLEKGEWTSSLRRLIPNNKKQAVAIADMVAHLGWKRVAVIYTTDIYGMSLALETMQECNSRDITVSTAIVIKSGSDSDTIKHILTEKLLPYEPRVILLLVKETDTDPIVSQAYGLNLVGAENAWVVGDGTTYYLEYSTGYNKLMYKGMLAIDQYVDGDSNDIQDLHARYITQKETFTSLSAGVYYSALILAKALETIKHPPSNETMGCQNIWSNGGSEAINKLNEVQLVDNSTNFNISFGANGAIVDARFTIMNYNGNKLVRIGEWFNSTTYIMENKITWFGTDQPDDRANSIRTVLKLGVNSDPPFIVYKKDNNSTTDCIGNDCYEGFCVDVIKKLSETLSFQYEFIESSDGMFGSTYANGSWNGLVRMLIDKEIHIATVGLGTSSKREKVIDFSANMLDGGVYFLSKQKQETRSRFFFMQPFSATVWIGMLVGAVITTLISWLLDRYSVAAILTPKKLDARHYQHENSAGFPKKRQLRMLEKDARLEEQFRADPDNNYYAKDYISLPQSIWLVVCSFLCTAPADEIPRSWGSRVVLTAWWVVCLVMISSYTADLAAYLTVSRIQSGYASLDSILADSNIRWGTVSGSVSQLLLENSSIKKHKDLASKSENVNSYAEGIAEVQKGNYVFMYGIGPLEYAAGSEPCNMEVLDIPLVSFGYAFGFPQNSPYRDTINTAMLVLQETGYLVDLWSKWSGSGCSRSSSSINADLHAVDFEDLIDLLFVLGPLLILAILINVAQWIRHYWLNQKKGEGEEVNGEGDVYSRNGRIMEIQAVRLEGADSPL